MKTRLIATLSSALAICALGPAAASALNLTQTFDTNNEGWLDTSDTNCTDPPSAATWSNVGGNPGGAIDEEDEDSGDLCPWFFIGPAPNGNRVANYGGSVAFDLRAAGAPTRTIQVGLADSEGKAILASTAAAPAANVWTTSTFTLLETAPHGWQYVEGGNAPIPATRAHIFDVLTDLNFVQILGDMTSGGSGDITRLDNFEFLEPAIPLDTDGDGVTNAADNCPLVPGPASNNGCPVGPPPDQDGDGVPDASDQCPTQAGPASNNGCPAAPNVDPDGDGLIGTADMCPDQAGPASNDGCPKGTDPPGGDDGACDAAKRKLEKAKAKLKKLRQNDAKPSQIAKAKHKVKRRSRL